MMFFNFPDGTTVQAVSVADANMLQFLGWVAPIQVNAPNRPTHGHWFLGEYFGPHATGGTYQLADGRVLDMGEIAEGPGRRYAPVPLYATRGDAERALARLRARKGR